MTMSFFMCNNILFHLIKVHVVHDLALKANEIKKQRYGFLVPQSQVGLWDLFFAFQTVSIADKNISD